MSTAGKTAKVLRVAPGRNGVAIAAPWRIWSQGSEFYAAVLNQAGFAKISFHSNGKWQFRYGHGLFRLSPPLKRGSGRFHACELWFLIGAGALSPMIDGYDGLSLVDVPDGHALRLHLIITPEGAPPEPNLVQALPLRDGRLVQVVHATAPLSAVDLATLTHLRATMRVNFDKLPKPGETTAEALEYVHANGGGNIVRIVPLFPECFVVAETQTAA
jgi:hypothetical protein